MPDLKPTSTESGGAPDHIIFVGHDATRTGAPTSLLRIVQWHASHTDLRSLVILREGGDLVRAYQEYAEVHMWSDHRESLRDLIIGKTLSNIPRLNWRFPDSLTRHRQSIIDRIQHLRPLAIFNNTGVNGDILELLRASLHAPIISRIPELEAYMRKNDHNAMSRRVLDHSDEFIAVSHAVRDNLVQRHRIDAQRIHIVHGACAERRCESRPNVLRSRLGLVDDQVLVGGCGTMDWRKGVDLFIQVANRTLARSDASNIHFCWIGSPVSRNSDIEYRYEAELLGIADRLHFVGEMDNAAESLADLDVFLLTSREDPFPLVMLEASRQGVPIVCFSGSGGAVEFVDDNCGVVLSMLDTEGMSSAVIRLIENPSLRRQLGENAYQKSLKFSVEAIGGQINQVISSAVERFAEAREARNHSLPRR